MKNNKELFVVNDDELEKLLLKNIESALNESTANRSYASIDEPLDFSKIDFTIDDD